MINGSEYFAVSYTTKGVVLTVKSGVPPASDGNSRTSKSTTEVARWGGEKHRWQGSVNRRVGEFAHLAAARRLEGSAERPYRLPELAVWHAPAMRTVAPMKSPTVGFTGENLHVANNWAAERANASVNSHLPTATNNWQKRDWQNNKDVRGTVMKRLLPGLR